MQKSSSRNLIRWSSTKCTETTRLQETLTSLQPFVSIRPSTINRGTRPTVIIVGRVALRVCRRAYTCTPWHCPRASVRQVQVSVAPVDRKILRSLLPYGLGTPLHDRSGHSTNKNLLKQIVEHE